MFYLFFKLLTKTFSLEILDAEDEDPSSEVLSISFMAGCNFFTLVVLPRKKSCRSSSVSNFLRSSSGFVRLK
jgi:hypothetical protein